MGLSISFYRTANEFLSKRVGSHGIKSPQEGIKRQVENKFTTSCNGVCTHERHKKWPSRIRWRSRWIAGKWDWPTSISGVDHWLMDHLSFRRQCPKQEVVEKHGTLRVAQSLAAPSTRCLIWPHCLLAHVIICRGSPEEQWSTLLPHHSFWTWSNYWMDILSFLGWP